MTMQTFFLFSGILCLLVCSSCAQTFEASYPSNHAFCDRPGFLRVDRSAWYKSGTSLTTSICVLSYYNVCATVSGVTPCNKAVGECRDVEYAWDNTTLNAASASVMARAPQVCAGPGAYFHPEVAVFGVAQPILACIIGLVCVILTVLGVKRAGGLPGLWTLFALMIFSCVFLLFGVWYLNAYLAVLVTITGVGMFASRHKPAILIGLLSVFIGLLWFTYSPGLGYIQHSFRVANPALYRAEAVCNAFYNGYFADPIEFKSSFISPLRATRRNCLREYVGVEMFFVFFIELLFLMLFAYGGYTMANVVGKKKE